MILKIIAFLAFSYLFGVVLAMAWFFVDTRGLKASNDRVLAAIASLIWPYYVAIAIYDLVRSRGRIS